MKKISKLLLGVVAFAAVFGIVKVVVDEVKNKDIGDDWDDMEDDIDSLKDIDKHYIKIHSKKSDTDNTKE